MTAAICLKLRDEGRKALKAQILLYPEARVPFDTPAAEENNSGLYLECELLFMPFSSSFPYGSWSKGDRFLRRLKIDCCFPKEATFPLETCVLNEMCEIRQRYLLLRRPLSPTRHATQPSLCLARHA